jgi:heme/copper-type cytochrome/quinol oxidase subunit 3
MAIGGAHAMSSGSAPALGPGPAAAGPRGLPGLEAGKIAIWWFLASEIMVFGGLLASFIVFRVGGGGWHEASEHLSVTLAAVNTLVLLTSSLTVVQAFAAAERGDAAAVRRGLGLTIAGGLVFLAIKAVEYTTEIQQGFTPGAGIFWSFYYGMTGLHGLHVAGGIAWNAVLLLAPGLRSPRRVELAGLYWHFVDVVWIFLFPLLYLS